MKGLRIVVDISPISLQRGRWFRRHVLSLLNALQEDKSPNRYSFLSRDKTLLDRFFPRDDARFRIEHPWRRIPMLHRRPSWMGHLGKYFLSDVDVVHFPCSDIWLGPPRMRAVVTLHDFIPFCFPERFFKNAKEEKSYRFLLDRIAENATLLIAVSQHTRNEALKFLRVKPERVRTVYNAVDSLFLTGTKSSSRKEMEELGLGVPFFLFVGALDFRKNIPLLLEAFSLYRAKGGKANLVLVGNQDPGNPTYFPPLEPLLEKSKDRKYIVWLRNVTDELLPGIYAKALALVFPSMAEGFGYPLVEAMASGIPVIASKTTCLPEIAGGAAWLVELTPEDWAHAMAEVEEDKNLRERLVTKGRKRLEVFYPARFAEDMLAVYRQALTDGKSPQ